VHRAHFTVIKFIVTSPSGAAAKYCDEYVCMCVCLSASISIHQVYFISGRMTKSHSGRGSFGGFSFPVCISCLLLCHLPTSSNNWTNVPLFRRGRLKAVSFRGSYGNSCLSYLTVAVVERCCRLYDQAVTLVLTCVFVERSLRSPRLFVHNRHADS